MAIVRTSLLLATAAVAAVAAFALPASADETASLPRAKVLAPLKVGHFGVGAKNALMYYQADKNSCHVSVILADGYDETRDYTKAAADAVRFNATIAAGTSTRVETAGGPALALWCAPTAATLFVQTVDRVAYAAPAN